MNTVNSHTKNTSKKFKTKTCLISFSISLALGGVAVGQGMTITYTTPTDNSNIDPFGNCSSWFSPQTAPSNPLLDLQIPSTGNTNDSVTKPSPLYLGTSTTSIDAQTLYNSQVSQTTHESGICAGSSLSNCVADFSITTNGTSSAENPNNPPQIPICTLNNSSGNNFASFIHSYGELKFDPMDFSGAINPTPSLQITMTSCAKPVDASYYLPTFTCAFNNFTNGVPSANKITSTQIPEIVADIGSAYDWKQNPLLNLGNYFQDSTTAANAGEKTPGSRIYYSISLGNTTLTPTPQAPQSITNSSTALSRPLNLEMGTSIQFVTGGEADYRQMLSTQSTGLTTANPLSLDANTQDYCSQAGGANTPTGIYYQCTVNVCACDPSLDTIQNPPTPIIGGCKVNGNSVVNDPNANPYSPNASGLNSFACPSRAYTPGGTGPVQTSFLLDLITPFRGATVQEIATNNALQAGNIPNITPAEQAALAFNGITRLVIPVKAGSTSEIPLDQYFISGTTFLNTSSSVTYAIVGLNNVSSVISSRPNKFNGTIANPTEPLLSSKTVSSDWSPIKIIPGQDPATPLTPTQDGVTLSISSNNLDLEVNTSRFTPTDGGLYQLTIQATSTDASNNGAIAYQTIYLNISPKNTSEYDSTGNSSSPGVLAYSPLKPFNSSWMYLPGFITSKNKTTTTSPSASTPVATISSTQTDPTVCSIDPTPGNSSANQTSVDPCTVYSDTLTQLSNNGTPIQYLTPDMMWLAYPGSVKTFPAPDGPNGTYQNSPTNNNFFTDTGSHIQKVLDYFHKNNPNVGVILTAEMDNPVMGDLGTLQEFLPPSQEGQAEYFTQMERLVFSTVLPFIATQANGNAGPITNGDPGSYGYNDLLSGLQFDVEPFKNSPEAADYYRGVADILARHGKVFETFAFADASMPIAASGVKNIYTASITMAMGPLGIFLPSMYDVGNNTDPKYATTYAANYMPKFSSGYPLIDNNCHWSGQFASDYTESSYIIQNQDLSQHIDGTSFPIGAYCNLNLTDTLYNNASLMGLLQQPGGSTPYFTEMMQTYGGHFQMAVPSQGSAENFTAQIVINPVCFPVDERGVAPADGIIPPLDPNVVNSDPYSQVLNAGANEVCGNPPVGDGIVNVIPGLPSNYVYGGNLDTDSKLATAKEIEYMLNGVPNNADFSNANPINDVNLNTVISLLEKNLTPGTYYMATDHYCINENGGSSGFKPDPRYPNESFQQACRYLVFLSNKNNEGSLVSNQFYPEGGTTDSQDTYIQALIGFANGNFDNEFKYSPTKTINPVPDIGTPATNPANLGMALYAISSESTTGCFVNESHSLKPNCLLALPVTTPLYDPSGGNAPSGQYSLSNLSMVGSMGTNSYELQWTLNCTKAPTSGFLATSQLYADGGISPQTRLTQWIDPTKTPISCGSTNTTTFTLSKGTFPSATQISLVLQSGGTFENMTAPVFLNIASNSMGGGANPVWQDVFNYTQPVSISNLVLESRENSSSYTLDWTLNCATPPSAGFLATSQLYNNGIDSPLTRLTHWIDPTKTPISCGSPNKTTFALSKGIFPSADKVSLVLQSGGTFNNMSAPVSIPFSISTQSKN